MDTIRSLCSLFGVACALLAHAQGPGELDPSFGTDGIVFANIGNSLDDARDVIVQPDGKILVLGTCIPGSGSGSLALQRYTATGALDPTFNGTGRLVCGFYGVGWWSFGQALALRPDGRILAAGRSSGPPNTRIAIMGIMPDGTMDTSWGDEGQAVTDVSTTTDDITAIALQDDGKLVAACLRGSNYTVVRYLTDGSLDPSFGGDGIVLDDFGGGSNAVYDVTIDADGRIVVAGYRYLSSNQDFAVARYLPDGTLDASFGGTGKVYTNMGTAYDKASAVAILPDDRILVGGTVSTASNGEAGLAMYLPDGTLDTDFSTDGIQVSAIGSSNEVFNGMAVQPDGGIVLTGVTGTAPDQQIIIARFLPGGAPDPSFGIGGVRTIDPQSGTHIGNAVALQGDGRIVVAGTTVDGTLSEFNVVRCNADGSMDATFAGDGTIVSDMLASDDEGQAAALLPDGDILVAGWTYEGGRQVMYVARFNADGSRDLAFGAGGVARVLIGTAQDRAHAMALRPDGRILVGGYANDGVTAGVDFAVAQFLSNGTIDASFGTGGTVRIAFPEGGSSINDLAVLPDGRVVAVGYVGVTGQLTNFAVACLMPDGSVDASFGNNGRFVHGFTNNQDPARAVQVAPDGGIVVVGEADMGPSYFDFALLKLLPDGSLDPSFSGDGLETTDYDSFERGYDAVIRPDGRILVAGGALNGFTFAQYLPDGTLDAGFSGDGWSTIPTTGESVEAVALWPDGDYIAAGFEETSLVTTGEDIMVKAYKANGALDFSFATNSTFLIDLGGMNDLSHDVLLQPDHKAIVVGTSSHGYENLGQHTDVVLLRLGAAIINGIAEAAPGSFTVYPNPAQGVLRLRFASPVRNATLMVTDAQGRIAYQDVINGSSHSLDLRGQAPGLYALTLHTAGGMQVQRVVVQP
ncbi:MAG TPA: T9SS type A sorting domain-containing protein [Flavobacteriales bacterium]|nr:T9SS type A sorting domain-containing protein [Flavobacteriales bacterium]